LWRCARPTYIALERFLLPETDSLLFLAVKAGAAHSVPERDQASFRIAPESTAAAFCWRISNIRCASASALPVIWFFAGLPRTPFAATVSVTLRARGFCTVGASLGEERRRMRAAVITAACLFLLASASAQQGKPKMSAVAGEN